MAQMGSGAGKPPGGGSATFGDDSDSDDDEDDEGDEKVSLLQNTRVVDGE